MGADIRRSGLNRSQLERPRTERTGGLLLATYAPGGVLGASESCYVFEDPFNTDTHPQPPLNLTSFYSQWGFWGFHCVNQVDIYESHTKGCDKSLPAISHSCKRISVSVSQFITLSAKSTPMYSKSRSTTTTS